VGGSGKEDNWYHYDEQHQPDADGNQHSLKQRVLHAVCPRGPAVLIPLISF